MNHQTIRTLLIFSVLSSTLTSVIKAEERFNINIGVSQYQWMGDRFSSNKFNPYYFLSLNYGILEFVEVGGQLGYSEFEFELFNLNCLIFI
jgi:hypothetical protein